jgi:acetyl-CoA synthetase
MVDVQAELHTWIARFATGDHDIANLLCERHAEDPRRLALRYEDAEGHEEQLTYRELADLSARFANRLAAVGVGRGDRVATLLPKCPELLIAAVGLWRLGAVHVPLFTAFGPDAIGFRLDDAAARVVITDTRNSGKLLRRPEPMCSWSTTSVNSSRVSSRAARWLDWVPTNCSS